MKYDKWEKKILKKGYLYTAMVYVVILILLFSCVGCSSTPKKVDSQPAYEFILRR